MDGAEVQFEGAGKGAEFSADVAQVPGKDNLNNFGIQVSGDGEVAPERGVAVFFVHGLVGVAATRAHEDLLEAITTAEPAQGGRVAVVEVFVADEDIVEIGRSTGQMFSEQIGVEGEVDRVGTDLETAAAGPF